MLSLKKILSELYPKTVSDFDTMKYGDGSADTAQLKSTPKLKNFFEIQRENSNHKHHYKLKCKLCESVQTCRCTAPKKEIIGICYECANINYNGTPKVIH